MKYLLILSLFFLFGFGKINSKPNVIIINLDDLGIGDVSAYQRGKLKTPNFDFLANNGVKFTQAYSTSATCTPSRFGLLTGTYPWRQEGVKILDGNAPLILKRNTFTLATIFKQSGYSTSVIGKWHLGLGFEELDWNAQISGTPNDFGFDYSFIMAATNDRVPCVYIENRNVLGLLPEDPLFVSYNANFEGQPTGLSQPELANKMKPDHGHNNTLHRGIPRIGFMKGGTAALWDDETMADTFLQKVNATLDAQNPKRTKKPFFLYYAMHQPHVPRVPHPRFAGKSGMGPRGDAILEADWCVGELLKKLNREGLLATTLIIFTSDNGPVLNDGYQDDAVQRLGKHTPNGGLRGGKYSLFDGGTHIPFVVYWNGTINPRVSDALVGQVDIMASICQLLQVNCPGIDSENMLNEFLGKSVVGRKYIMIEASGKLALRQDKFVMIPPNKGDMVDKNVNIELGNSPYVQLYNLEKDPAQKQNIATLETYKVNEMKAIMNLEIKKRK
jgi:arylsulfatase A-like enzyme